MVLEQVETGNGTRGFFNLSNLLSLFSWPSELKYKPIAEMQQLFPVWGQDILKLIRKKNIYYYYIDVTWFSSSFYFLKLSFSCEMFVAVTTLRKIYFSFVNHFLLVTTICKAWSPKHGITCFSTLTVDSFLWSKDWHTTAIKGFVAFMFFRISQQWSLLQAAFKTHRHQRRTDCLLPNNDRPENLCFTENDTQKIRRSRKLQSAKNNSKLSLRWKRLLSRCLQITGVFECTNTVRNV